MSQCDILLFYKNMHVVIINSAYMFELYIHLIKMSKRLWLYFETYAWERMNRYLSYLLMSGKPFYELPTMNDLVEAMVVYVSREIIDGHITPKDFSQFFGELPSNHSKNKFNLTGKDKGRIGFNITRITEDAITEIRKIDNKYRGKEKSNSLLPDGVTDPLVIRACAYYVVTGFRPNFIDQVYFSFLYNIRPSMLISTKTVNFEFEYMTEQERFNVKKIAWDDSVLKPLLYVRLVPHSYPSEPKIQVRKPEMESIARLDIGSIDGPMFSRGFGFDYREAFIGYAAIRNGVKSDVNLPHLLVSMGNPIAIKGVLPEMKDADLITVSFFLDRLSDIQAIIDKYPV